ncbi:MAG TPA: hypothetical protein VF018_17760 [Acidobacteriaceae bacterium]
MIRLPDGASTNPRLQRWTTCLLTALPVFASILWLGGTFHRNYGPTHYFLNYRHGFLKRALLGELLLPLHFIGLHTILAIELVIFATVSAVTYIVFRRTLFGALQERALAAFLLAAPALLPHLAYLSGDLDNLLYICAVLALGAFLVMPANAAVGCAIALSFVALLIHEAFLLLFYPLLLAIMVDLWQRHRLRRGLVIAQLVLVALAFFAILHFGKWSVPHPEYMAAAQQRTDMPLEGTVFLVLSNTLQQQLHFVAALYTKQLIAGVLLSCLVSLPYFAMLVSLIQDALAARGYTDRSRWSLLLLLCTPLLLLPLGHDVMRWISAICINVSLFLLYLYSTASESDERRALTDWTTTPLYPAMLGYTLALGAYGIASTRLITNVGNLLSGRL